MATILGNRQPPEQPGHDFLRAQNTISSVNRYMPAKASPVFAACVRPRDLHARYGELGDSE